MGTRYVHVVRCKNPNNDQEYFDVQVTDKFCMTGFSGYQDILDFTAKKATPTIIDNTPEGNGVDSGSRATRQSHMVRITNPKDSTQFFDLEVLDKSCYTGYSGYQDLLDLRSAKASVFVTDVSGANIDQSSFVSAEEALGQGKNQSSRLAKVDEVDMNVIKYPIDNNSVSSDPNTTTSNFISVEDLQKICFTGYSGYQDIFDIEKHFQDIVDTTQYDTDANGNSVPPDNKDPNIYVAFAKDASGITTGNALISQGPLWKIINFSDNPWLFFLPIVIAGGDTGSPGGLGPFTLQAVGNQVFSFSYLAGWEMHRASPGSSSGTFVVGNKTFNYTGMPNVSLGGSFSPWTVCGFDDPQVPFSGRLVAVKTVASGPPYLHYPNDAKPESGWVAALSFTAQFLAWNGTGPFNVYGTDPSNSRPGMLTNVTEAQFKADWVDQFPSVPNQSIYEYGDVEGSTTVDLSGITVTSGSGTWLPVAISMGGISLRDGFHQSNAGGGDVVLLLKRQG
jgi:hypothetical protein